MSARIDNSKEVEVVVVARVAGKLLGRIASPFKPSVHLTILIKDLYSGIIGIDGQPDPTFRIKGFAAIKTNFYQNYVPSDLISIGGREIEIPIKTPDFMTPRTFAESLVKNAKNFTSHIVQYSAPIGLGGEYMTVGEYNSSSYVIGLLNSVEGGRRGYQYLIRDTLRDYQVPGIEAPIPAEYFTG